MSNGEHSEDAMAAMRKQQEDQMTQQIRVTSLSLAVHFTEAGSTDDVLTTAASFEKFIKEGS